MRPEGEEPGEEAGEVLDAVCGVAQVGGGVGYVEEAPVWGYVEQAGEGVVHREKVCGRAGEGEARCALAA